MEQYIKQFDDKINNGLSKFVRKPTLVRGMVHLLLILYAARIAPALPKQVNVVFENAYFKLFVFSMILWTAQFSPSTSILLAVAFLVSTNFVNNKPLWEFLENVQSDPTTPPMAPTKQVGVDAVVGAVTNQSQSAQVVSGVAQKQETILIQPSIVDTPNGPAVVNPTVVIGSAVVSSPNGDRVVVKPDVTVVEAPPAPTMSTPPASTMMAPAPPAPMSEVEVSNQDQVGCYPVRRYDMTKISAYESADNFGTI